MPKPEEPLSEEQKRLKDQIEREMYLKKNGLWFKRAPHHGELTDAPSLGHDYAYYLTPEEEAKAREILRKRHPDLNLFEEDNSD